MTDAFYPTPADLLRDLVEIILDEVRWLVSEVVRLIELQAPDHRHYTEIGSSETGCAERG